MENIGYVLHLLFVSTTNADNTIHSVIKLKNSFTKQN